MAVDLLCSGTFRLRFRNYESAREAGRDAGAAGFATTLADEKTDGWSLVVARRNQPFPRDEEGRYSGRLRTIATTHGGAFEGFTES
ncbi:MAG TPA: hypothetical protein VNT58_04215 [Gaiellaceae bacterium]|nr:hypothetical protein [Gaiellaceae bacterium]